MDHDTAVKQRIASRYMLGELSSGERDEFEAHFFDCGVCADDVRSGAVLAANARAVFRHQALDREASGARGWWARWVDSLRMPVLAPSAAALLLAVVAGWQAFVTIPALRQAVAPQAIATAVLHPAARGAEKPIVIARDARFFQIEFDVNAPLSFDSFESEIIRPSGERVLTVSAPGGPDVRSLNVLLPAQQFETGEYTLILRGRSAASPQNPVEVDRYRFGIERR